jgi:hypothetical protein|tara:strand:- start:1157 stop:1444 length:288 start_codon:yes stop_codon:yes gene_type:complete
MIFNKKDDLKIEKIMKKKPLPLIFPTPIQKAQIPEKIKTDKKRKLIIPGRINRMYGGEMKKKEMMYGGMAKKKMMKGGRTMYGHGGEVMPKAKPC